MHVDLLALFLSTQRAWAVDEGEQHLWAPRCLVAARASPGCTPLLSSGV